MKNEIFDKINAIIKKNNFNIILSEKNLDMELKALNIDSLAAMSIVIAIEEELNIRLDDEKLKKLRYVKDLISAVEQKLK